MFPCNIFYPSLIYISIIYIYIITIVGSRFSAQAQDAWDLRSVSPVQWICKKRAKELGFSVWTTVNMVFFMIKLRWTEFTREDWSSAWSEKLFLVPLVCWGVLAPPFCLLPLPFYSSFLLPKWGSLGRYLSHQPFPPAVGSGCKGRKAWLCQAQGTKFSHGSFSLWHSHFLRCHFLL